MSNIPRATKRFIPASTSKIPHTVPLSAHTYDLGRTLFKERASGTYTLYAKTGWKHNPPDMDIGWYVGWIEDSATLEIYVFSLNMDLPNRDDHTKRKPIVMAALRAIGAWPD